MNKYFHEDMVLMFHILFVILCFGFNFKVAGWIFVVLGILQFIKTAMIAAKEKRESK
jgi:hypothetical protein